MLFKCHLSEEKCSVSSQQIQISLPHNVVQQICCDAKANRELLCHCNAQTQHGGSVALSSNCPCHSVPSSRRQCRGLRINHVKKQADFTNSDLDLSPEGKDNMQLLWFRSLLSYTHSNPLFLSKETASLVKSESFQQAGNVCSHSWLTTQPLFTHGVCRQANFTAEYQGKRGPNPPQSTSSRCQQELS